jgi:hypothetical protein
MVESSSGAASTNASGKEVVLVTGITGFVGSWVGKLLLE